MIDFDNRTVLVTGGGRGIGRAAAEAFAARGATVVVNDVGGSKTGEGSDERPADEAVAAIEDAGGTAVAEYSDVGTMDGAASAVEHAYEAFGHLDVLYNNAGILRESSLVSMTESEFDEVIRVHLKGMFAVLQAAARRWREEHKESTEDEEGTEGEQERTDEANEADVERERAVVNASSDIAAGAFLGPNSAFGLGNYAMAKAGILGLTRTAAEELANYDVRVNAVWPIADTRLTETLPLDLPAPEPVAAAVLYLASDDCDLTGQTLRVGGDRLDLVEPAPLPRATAYAGGDAWSAEEISDRFDETLGEHVRRL